MPAQKQMGTSCFDMYFFGILIAVELLMSFTALGYIHIPPISITTVYMPILLVACLLGPVQALIAGAVFGLASMYKASASYVMPSDAIFSPLLSGFPVSSILLSVGARALFGLLIGIMFAFALKSRHSRIWAGLSAAIAPKLHSFIVYAVMGLLFPEQGYTYTSVLKFNTGDILLSIISLVIVILALNIYQSKLMQHIKMYIDLSNEIPYSQKSIGIYFILFEFFILFIAIFATQYFSQRTSYMLIQHGFSVSNNISSDMLILQAQFMLAMLSLNAISVILLILIYKYMTYKVFFEKIDALTGIMGRKMFLSICEYAQKVHTDAKTKGWFLFIDTDYFKSINDTLGHATGDMVLKKIATALHDCIGKDGHVGRIGGDEFAAIIENSMSQQELEKRLQAFLDTITDILPDRKTTCSIGACQFVFPQAVKNLLTETDAILYKAKENGRACYVIQVCNEGTNGLHA